jgi:hypothetical protein
VYKSALSLIKLAVTDNMIFGCIIGKENNARQHVDWRQIIQ